ncbi:hypoxanthine phosphoribosyltransferase [Clostridium sp. D2Q-11]|uniref:Hypoxanthine phosphoribosyltransferase n=1 Tax=Anaeromonas frigoriresistens TaxID=2683708 RepID=A0A942UU78_9FIRM|nr:hypoxanthine phosphoribosyltransferase [Anaeromonas frigoriresistens]MBS4539223.1 hypoxanthine phosphoribosyltransferase [Anaeromonas frigoriresistens]
MTDERKVVISKEEISSKVKELGEEITKDYKDKKLLVVSLLKGSFVFTADLVRSIDLMTRIEFMTTSSYGHGEQSSGKVKIVNDLKVDVKDYDILIVDDIVDSGNTMKFIVNYLKDLGPKSVKSCVLLDKPERREVEIEPDYCGFTIPDLFIAGYGLNYGDYYRNVPDIFVFENK